MPSKKKARGKERKARTLARKDEDTPQVQEMVRQLRKDGCIVSFDEKGAMLMRHPCMNGMNDLNMMADSMLMKKLGHDRSYLNDKEKQEFVSNYIHNYADDLRGGIFEGTNVIIQNLACSHLGPLLCEALVERGIHDVMLQFLSHCEGKLSLRFGGKDITSGQRDIIPRLWMDVLALMLGYDDDIQWQIAESIEPVVACMVNAEKREFFQSKDIWHQSVTSFLFLVGCLNRSVEVRLTMMKYEGFLPFIAQACSWMISRDDIVTESKWLQLDFPMTTTCMEAQKVLSFIIRDFDDVDMFRGLLKRIASTPLLSNDPDCNDSIIVGLVRTLKIEPQQKHRFIEEHHDWLKHIIETLLLAEHVDARVIAELIKCGRQSSSIESSKFIVKMMMNILGLDGNNHTQWSDSRFAAAIRNGCVEFCMYASTGDHLESFAKGLYTMAMHKKTAHALREKRSGIFSALDVLKNKSPSQHDRISPLISDSLDFGTSICCNCLKEFDRKDLRFCTNCIVGCYSARSC